MISPFCAFANLTFSVKPAGSIKKTVFADIKAPSLVALVRDSKVSKSPRCCSMSPLPYLVAVHLSTKIGNLLTVLRVLGTSMSSTSCHISHLPSTNLAPV